MTAAPIVTVKSCSNPDSEELPVRQRHETRYDGREEDEDQEDGGSRILYTILIYLTYLCHGLGYITSSTLLDVADQTRSTPVLVSIGFSVKTMVYCLGAVFFSCLLNHLDRPIGLMIALTGAATATFLVPLVSTVSAYWVTQAMAGFCNAGLDITCLSWLLNMWSSDSVNPFMQGLYLCFSSGMMISSLIAAPFLSHVAPPDHQAMDSDSVSTPGPEIAVNSTSADVVVVPIEALLESRLIIPYSLIAGFCLMVTLAHAVAYVWKPYVSKQRSSSASSLVHRASTPVDREDGSVLRRFVSQMSSRTTDSTGTVVQIVLLGSLLLGCLEGAGYSNSSFMPTFAVFCDLHLTKQEGAVMYSLISGSAAVTLMVTAWIATRISSRNLLYVGTSAFFAGNVCLLYSASHSVHLMIGSVVMLGIGYAIFAPNTYSFLSSQLDLTNAMFGCFTFTKSVGRSLAAYVTGIYIQDHPLIMIFVNMTCLFLSMIIILLFHFKLSPQTR